MTSSQHPSHYPSHYLNYIRHSLLSSPLAGATYNVLILLVMALQAGTNYGGARSKLLLGIPFSHG